MSQATHELKETLGRSNNIVVLVKGLLISYFITLPIFIMFAFILTYTDFPEKYISPAVVITTVVSVLIAGSTMSKNARSKGWLNGAVIGAVYMVLLYLISSMTFGNFEVNRYVVTMLVIGIVTGTIGGILGINIKSTVKSKRKR